MVPGERGAARAVRRGVPARNAWAARYWSPIAGAEALATRDGVALYDMTSLKRLEVTGRGALAFLDGLTTNALDRPVGTVVYTLMLDERGGIRCDLTIARLGRDRFQVGANGNLDLDRLSRLAPPDGSRPCPGHHLRHVLHRPVGTARP